MIKFKKQYPISYTAIEITGWVVFVSALKILSLL